MSPFFRHYKGRYYQMIDEAHDTQTESSVVLYRTLYASEYSLFTRPKDEFFGTVCLPDGTRTLRFTPVAREELPQEARERILSTLAVRDAEESCPPPHPHDA